MIRRISARNERKHSQENNRLYVCNFYKKYVMKEKEEDIRSAGFVYHLSKQEIKGVEKNQLSH